jgi:hypothetical protein
MNRFLLKKFSEAPMILDQRKFSSHGSGETFLEKFIFVGKLFFKVEIHFGIFFLHIQFIPKCHFLTMKRFRKATSKLEGLCVNTMWRLPTPLLGGQTSTGKVPCTPAPLYTVYSPCI